MKITELLEFNRLGTIAWFINGKLLHRRSFGLPQILMLNVLTPLMRMADKMIPVPPLSLIAVMVKSPQSDSTVEGLPAAHRSEQPFRSPSPIRVDANDKKQTQHLVKML